MHGKGRLADPGGTADRGDDHRVGVAGQQAVKLLKRFRSAGECVQVGGKQRGRDRPADDRRHRTRQRVAAQNSLVDPLESLAGVQAEFVGEALAGVLEDVQSICGAAVMVQGEHVQLDEPFPDRTTFGGVAGQFGKDFTVAAQFQARRDGRLDRL
jgi:hypothetical protein